MSVLARPLTFEELDQFPNDGKRREIIGGILHVSPAPLKEHQRVLRRLTILFDAAAEAADAGEVFFAPEDVRFGEHDQVQPDLIFFRKDRLDIYEGNTVHGAPDLILEVLSPSTRAYDEREKAELYAREGVTEYWITDLAIPALRPQLLVDGVYAPIEPEVDGTFRSTVIPNLVIDPAQLFAGFDR
jgi:Uma2 family endonuclease